MKLSISRILIPAILCLGIAVATPSMVGCSAGQTARDKIMEPALLNIASSIRADAERGASLVGTPGDEIAINGLFDAIATEDHVSAKVPVLAYWPTVKTLAYAGIDDREGSGELGPLGAQSFKLRVDEYGAALERWVGD